MVALYIYLGTIVISIGSNVLVIKAMDKEVENRGYAFVEKKKNLAEEIIESIKFFCMSLIPILNIIISSIMFFKYEELSNQTIANFIKDGTLVKKEDPIIEEEKNNDKVIQYNVNNEITKEEKIKFLKEELQRLTGKNVNIEIKQEKGRQKRR